MRYPLLELLLYKNKVNKKLIIFILVKCIQKMGVRGLFSYSRKYLKPYKNDTNLRVGVDVSSLLYRFKGNFKEIYTFLDPILQNKLLFVFDGKAPKYKEKELELRAESKQQSENRIKLLRDSLEKNLNTETEILIKNRIKDLEHDSWNISIEVIQDFKEFLKLKNLYYVKSISEADLLLVDLYYHNYIDAVLSNDMDYLISGVDTLLINVNGTLKVLKLSEILESEDINIEQFREVAVLCGNRSEYSLCDDIDTAIIKGPILY